MLLEKRTKEKKTEKKNTHTNTHKRQQTKKQTKARLISNKGRRINAMPLITSRGLLHLAINAEKASAERNPRKRNIER